MDQQKSKREQVTPEVNIIQGDIKWAKQATLQKHKTGGLWITLEAEKLCRDSNKFLRRIRKNLRERNRRHRPLIEEGGGHKASHPPWTTSLWGG